VGFSPFAGRMEILGTVSLGFFGEGGGRRFGSLFFGKGRGQPLLRVEKIRLLGFFFIMRWVNKLIKTELRQFHQHCSSHYPYRTNVVKSINIGHKIPQEEHPMVVHASMLSEETRVSFSEK
jgi:hypothetical protein